MNLKLIEQPRSKKERAKAILEFLNKKAGRRYKDTTVNLNFIIARMDEGYTDEECRAVIAMKCREWLHDEVMKKYLRPMTLFNREKFNSYAGELEVE